jgi:hypothetical protein
MDFSSAGPDPETDSMKRPLRIGANIGKMKLLITTCTLLFLGLASVLGASDPFVGTWKLNVAKSKHLPGDQSAPWPKELIRTFEERGVDLVVTERTVSSDGRIQRSVFKSSSKGGAVSSVEGEGFPEGHSWVLKRIGNDMIIVRNQGGKTLRTGHMTVSANGKTMTVEEKGESNNPQRQSKEIHRIEVFDRQ